jgi:hypothetical protein
MIDSTPSGAVVHEGPAGTTQPVIEAHTGRETQKALQNALSGALRGATPVALQGERALAGPEDGLDTLADGSKVRPLSGLVFPSRPHQGGLEFSHAFGELPPRVAFVPQEDLPASSPTAGEKFQTHLPLVPVGRSECKSARGAVRGSDEMQTEAPEVAGVRGAVAIVGKRSSAVQ